MIKATVEFLKENDRIFECRKGKIKTSKTDIKITGTAYYVSSGGDDNNDGLSPETAWKTPKRVTDAVLKSGDGVFFKRGDLFRGKFITKSGVTYSAFGTGEKPKFYSHDKPLNNPDLWTLFDKEHNIWKLNEKILDVGTIVFDDGKAHSRKLIPSYRYGKFVCRDNDDKIFDMRSEMTNDLDLYWHYEDNFTTQPSKGEDFPIPELTGQSFGDLYLRCDKGNPAEVFGEIEANVRVHLIGVYKNSDVTIDNLCIKYVGMHGISAGNPCNGLTVTNCEFGWIGGCILSYSGFDPNYPPGVRGSVTRFGNAIEIYGSCQNYTVKNNYIYEVFDAGITHQAYARIPQFMTNVTYTDNVIEKCVYGIEYFLEQIEVPCESMMENILMENNFIRLSGYGWGQQRHNVDTPAHIKGWSYSNPSKNYVIKNNIFDRAAYRMLHLVTKLPEHLPEMQGNTYIQHHGAMLGQYGDMQNGEPPILKYDIANIEETIKNTLYDNTAKIYYID